MYSTILPELAQTTQLNYVVYIISFDVLIWIKGEYRDLYNLVQTKSNILGNGNGSSNRDKWSEYWLIINILKGVSY